MTTYEDFIATKSATAEAIGITDDIRLPRKMKAFQRDVAIWALRRGRAAIFAGTGLGKTVMQLAWADNVARHTSLPVLVLTPLAVAQQTVAEASKFGIDHVRYAKHQHDGEWNIAVSNYDRLDKFDMGEFGGIVLDESSIIKSHDSKTRMALIEACREMPFKLCCTATPAPNDWIELGNHAEFLGAMSEKEMLAMFFVHDGGLRVNGEEWRLKGHAQGAFWQWVCSWAALVRSPADLGYDEPGYELPPLNNRQITVPVEYGPQAGMLFPMAAHTMQERLAVRRSSIGARVAAVADIVNAQRDRPWLIWCHLNDEASALTAAIDGAIEVRGTDAPEIKTERLLGFCTGSPRVLVSKPSIAGWGMNWQHCADMVFVGLNDSFEQLYQAIRRCWRFGQAKPVNVYLVASELEGAVIANVEAKERAFEAMSEQMAALTKDLTRRAIKTGRLQYSTYAPQQSMELPSWL